MSRIEYNKEEDTYYFECPHCKQICQVPRNEIRCTIFRHAMYKHNMSNINPHASQRECEKMLWNDEVYGCAKPFRFDGEQVSICGFI